MSKKCDIFQKTKLESTSKAKKVKNWNDKGFSQIYHMFEFWSKPFLFMWGSLEVEEVILQMTILWKLRCVETTWEQRSINRIWAYTMYSVIELLNKWHLMLRIYSYLLVCDIKEDLNYKVYNTLPTQYSLSCFIGWSKKGRHKIDPHLC